MQAAPRALRRAVALFGRTPRGASSTYHNLHHHKLQGNYGLFTRVGDRAFGTELPGYSEVFSDRSRTTHLPE